MESYLETYDLTFPQGPIRGAKRETLYGTPYFSFEGIPFAKPPLGELRFKAPQPAEPWTETLDCTLCRSKPVQQNASSGQFEGSEDCLFINVYVNKLKSKKPLPVMVYIYGGKYYFGEATREKYGPDYIMNEEVVLIHFNYRVSSLGFLSLKDPTLGIPGNAGLKDQVLALKWVKKYISHFNGDIENITVFGNSAGGASAHFMALTDQTKGLFQKCILMSGCALTSWAEQPQTNSAYRLAKYNGYTGENIDKDVLEFLQKLELKKLVQHDLRDEEDYRNCVQFIFGPTVEPYITEDCVVPKKPLEMLKTAWSNSIPMMIGGTSDEGLTMYGELKTNPQVMNAHQNDFERLIPVEVRKLYSKEIIMKFAQMLKELHFGKKDVNEQALLEFTDYYSYQLFWHGIIRTILARLEYAPKAPTYLYRFNFDSPDFNFFRNIFCAGDPVRGVSHADDLCYLLRLKAAYKLEINSEEYKTIRRMVSLWTSFARNSNPNCDVIKTLWKPLEKSNPYQALNISNEIQLIEIPEKSKLEVWNSMYEKKHLY